MLYEIWYYDMFMSGFSNSTYPLKENTQNPRKNESGSAQVTSVGAPEALPGHSGALSINFENHWKESRVVNIY